MGQYNILDEMNDAAYEIDGIHAILSALYEKYLERSYSNALEGEELREFISAYGFCLDALRNRRHKFDGLIAKNLEVMG